MINTILATEKMMLLPMPLLLVLPVENRNPIGQGPILAHQSTQEETPERQVTPPKFR
jgi:hypothetical protein